MSLSWRFVTTVTTSSLNGIDVVNREIVWAAGAFDVSVLGESQTPGVVVRTVDGGQSWQDVTPPGGQGFIFHDVEAFDRNHALALAVGLGTDSRIFRTDDGGASWKRVFENQEPDAFYDAIAFFDPEHGIAMSDPVAGKFRILATEDGGRTWQVAPTNGMPPALPTEFAHATGTCLVTNGPQDAWFGTSNSRVFHTRDRGFTWSVVTTPIPGDPQQFGIASLAFWDTQHGLALGGGDPGTNAPSVVAVTADGGTTWSQGGSPAGFRISISVPTNDRDTAVVVGFTGSDFTTDGGHSWHLLDQGDLRGANCKLNVSCWAVGKNGMAAELRR
jgi:photosystem II stability/assembly factor-like uncharacterized protein